MRVRGFVASLTLISCAGQAPLEPLPRVPTGLAPAPPLATLTPPTPVKRAPAPAPSLPPAEPPPVSQGDIGSEGPLRLLGASSSGAWVALCDGEPKTAKLVLGSGLGEPIDDVLARDPSGRYLVVARDHSALLIDAVSGTRVDLSELGADLRRLRADYAEHRSLSFDPNGKYLAYLRKSAKTLEIVVRELETGSERTFAAGPGDVLSLRLSADARYVSFEALRDDTNHNGKLDWPAPEETARPNGCERPALPRFRSFGYQGRGDASVRGVVTLETGVVRDVPELVTPLGASLLVREADGSLRLERAGKRSQLAPSGCSGRVLFADADRELVVAACAPPPPKKLKGHAPPPPTFKREIWLFGAGFAKNLQSELYETSVDREAVAGTRLVPLYPGSEAGLLDLERRELLPLPSGSRVLATSGALAVIWRESDLYRYDAQTRSEQRLAHGVSKNPDLLRNGGSILLSPFVIVGSNGPARSGPEVALALTASGMVLTGSSQAPSGARGSGLIQGPLHWLDAKVAPLDGPPR